MEAEEITQSSQPVKTSEKKQTRTETSSNQKDSINWMIYNLLVRKEFDECLNMINKYAKESDGTESLFATYVKGLIKRYKGEINESLDLFKICYNVNTNSITMMKEIAKNFTLIGNYMRAIEVYDQILVSNPDDWESHHEKGACYAHLKDYNSAIELFNRTLELNNNEKTLMELAKIAIEQENFGLAIDKYQEAVSMTAENAELLSSIGALYLKLANSDEAFDYFNNAMLYDSSFSNALMGVASIHQDKYSYEQALIKYKLASISNPNSPLVWNNLGLCFFAKQKYIAAVTCLKKAIYLDPFEWIVAYNLGLVYLQQKQYASAFNYMNAASNLRQDFYLIYFFLGVILAQLGDIYNAIPYYDKSIELNENYLSYFNYSVSLYNNDMIENAKEKFTKFYKLYQSNRDMNAEYDQEILEGMEYLKKKLF